MPTGSSRKCADGCGCGRHHNGLTGRTQRTYELRRAAKLGTTRPRRAVEKALETKRRNGTTHRPNDVVGYHAVHHRVIASRGAASDCPCDWCGATSRVWAYNHLDPAERFWKGMAFTTNLEFYIPMCTGCSGALDREVKECRTAR